MRRLVVVFALLIAACGPSSATTSTVAPTVTTLPPTTSTTTTSTTLPPTTTTTVPPTTTTTLTPIQSLAYEEIAELPFPVQLVAERGSADSYVATKDGRVWLYDGESVTEGVLDIRDLVLNQGERGLLSIAIHPQDSGRFFAHYTANDGDTVVSEFERVSRETIEPLSERVLLRLNQPASNHNGGMIQFGPDGALYVGLGDGGGANDRFGNGQNTDTLLGGLVRLEVDGEPDPVLFSYGLRNPWRFWIEGDLIYVADVGQNLYEEVTVTSLAPGTNFGWPITEGVHCFRPSSGCDMAGQVLPQVEVAHGDGGSCSITGGIVYRGEDIPEISGHYFYSDYCGGYLRSLLYREGAVAEEVDWTDDVGIAGRVVGFGLDGTGEMYVATTTRLLKVVALRG